MERMSPSHHQVDARLAPWNVERFRRAKTRRIEQHQGNSSTQEFLNQIALARGRLWLPNFRQACRREAVNPRCAIRHALPKQTSCRAARWSGFACAVTLVAVPCESRRMGQTFLQQLRPSSKEGPIFSNTQCDAPMWGQPSCMRRCSNWQEICWRMGPLFRDCTNPVVEWLFS